MATFLITVVRADSGNQYVLIYDSNTGIEVTKHGTAPDDFLVTEAELGYANGELRYENCIDGDRHKIWMSTSYPFATFAITANDPTCMVAPPTPPGPPTIPPPTTTFNYIAYQVRYRNTENQIVEANIFDQYTYEPGREIEYRPLKASGEPVRLECIDNEEDKFTPIMAKQCIIEFNSSSQHNAQMFAMGEDNRWYVEVKIEGEIKFKGFLVMNDMQEDYLSPPNVVSLTATDSIGLLKDIPLTNFEGASPIVVRPKTKYRWLDYLGWALSKTSMLLPINIQHNLREEHNPYDPFWAKVYLDPKTFEDEIGTCIDCYKVLEYLLGEECTLFQRNGEWWIVRTDEIDSRNRYVYKVSADLTSWALDTSTFAYDKTVKKNQDIKWIDRSAYTTYDRPHGSIKETFNFRFPKEIIDNIDFTRGSQITVVVTPPDERWYFISDWTFVRYPTAPTAATAYIRRKFVNDVETERNIVISKSAVPGNTHALVSSRVPMGEKDKFNFSIDRALELNMSGSNFFRTAVAQIRLYADDGTFYVLDGDQTVGGNLVPSLWKTTDATFNLNAGYIWQEGNLSSDDRNWVTISQDVPPLPKAGEIEVLLLQTADIPNTSATYFANLRIDYIPFINGVYQKLSGQHWKVSQPGNYKAVRDQQVFVSDSPKKLFKGAMFYLDTDGKFKLTGKWFDYSLSPTIVPVIPDVADMKPYGWHQAQAVWNQYRKEVTIVPGDLLGITETDLPDLLHRYVLADPSVTTRDRYFKCLHYSMSLKSCEWDTYFIEVFKTDESKVYDSTTEFKYIENR